ncbi:MAG: DUF1844 domain-containing protein [Fimbriimonadaceae bacterium]|nr:DUF1844 domain-containing protein [Fimbriimonadaceae bacterium]
MSTEGNQSPHEPLSVYTVIMAMTEQMATLAWQKLGLQPDMMTGKVQADFEEAKVAIDITTQLASFIEPKLDENDKREIHNLIRDLRMNYVQKVKEKQT